LLGDRYRLADHAGEFGRLANVPNWDWDFAFDLPRRLLPVFESIRSRTSIRDCSFFYLFDVRRKAA
jgi:hypothetical protein